MTLAYSEMFRCTRAWSIELQDPVRLAWMRANGFAWIRPMHRRWELSVRRPTVGCIVELGVMRQVGMVPLDSAEGRRIIRRLCWP